MSELDVRADQPKMDSTSQFDKPILLQGSVEKHDGELRGAATEQSLDPDALSRELLIEWDQWRNKVARQVSQNLSKHMNGLEGCEIDFATRRITSKFPYGVHAGVDFVIDAEQKVLKAEIVSPSGYPEYDRLLVKSVVDLGKGRQARLLRFPENSRRKSVEQVMDLQRVQGIQPQRYLNFGDTERVSLE